MCPGLGTKYSLINARRCELNWKKLSIIREHRFLELFIGCIGIYFDGLLCIINVSVILSEVV